MGQQFNIVLILIDVAYLNTSMDDDEHNECGGIEQLLPDLSGHELTICLRLGVVEDRKVQRTRSQFLKFTVQCLCSLAARVRWSRIICSSSGPVYERSSGPNRNFWRPQ